MQNPKPVTERIAVLCDAIGEIGGAEHYWLTVLPALNQTNEVRLFARFVTLPLPAGLNATEISWADEHDEPNGAAAKRVSEEIEGCSAVITANVLDSAVLEAVRASGARWIVRIHDHRPFCPNGNKVFPQFPAICTAAMGRACAVNTALRGCVQGPRRSSLDLIARRMRVRDAIAKADAVIVSSEYMRALCMQNGIPAHIVQITPPPLADDFLSATSAPTTRDVLFFGRATAEKGLLSLMRAIGTIERTSRPPLAVAARVDEREAAALHAAAKQTGVNLSLLGYLSQAKLKEAIDAARIVALPSLWPEPFGLAGTQAQARARPVVAYDVGGVREWIERGGIAVRRGDERALGRAISSLSSDDTLWSELSRHARENAQAYRLERHLAALTGIISPSLRKEIA